MGNLNNFPSALRERRRNMRTKEGTAQVIEEEITVTLPATALEALGEVLEGQLSSGRGTLPGSAGRGEPFPCFKKASRSKRLVVKTSHEYSASNAL
jgi:hypothetical protein